MKLTAYIQDREIASKDIVTYHEADFQRRVQNHERIVKEEMNRVGRVLKGTAYRVTFILTAKSKMK